MKRLSQNRMFIVFSVALILSSLANANANIGDLSRDEFNLITKQWKFECKDKELLRHKPDTADYMREIIPDIVWQGMEEVALQNPQFVQQILKNIKNDMPVTINCKKTTGSTEAVTNRSKIKTLFRIGNVAFGLPRKENFEIQIGRSITKCLVSSFIKNTPKDAKKNYQYAPSQLELSSYEVEVSELIRESCNQTIFHEFLHLAQMDNKSVEEHNKPTTEGVHSLGYLSKSDDVVYACTRMAFKYGSASKDTLNSYMEIPFPEKMNRSAWMANCKTCTLAQYKNNTVIQNEDPMEQERARYSCNKLYDEIPNMTSATVSGAASKSALAYSAATNTSTEHNVDVAQ